VDTVFVKLNADLKCEWEGLPPDYRIYVDDELFAERTYRWEEPFYLREILQVNAEVDRVYHVHLEPVGPQLANFSFSNLQTGYCERQVRLLPDSDRLDKFSFKVRP
jgi:hypothetical protein